MDRPCPDPHDILDPEVPAQPVQGMIAVIYHEGTALDIRVPGSPTKTDGALPW